MSRFFKKLLVILITVFTLGTVTPPAHLLASNNKSSNEKSNIIDDNSESNESVAYMSDEPEEPPESEATQYQVPWQEIAAGIQDNEELGSTFIDYTTYQANVQMMKKFGPRMSERLEDQYKENILPKFEEAIRSYSKNLDKETLKYMVMTEEPAGGQGERVFHITNGKTGEDIFRFHVRREHPPEKGYWFAFHYHHEKDNFAKHYELGKLYWDKNTPPKWQA